MLLIHRIILVSHICPQSDTSYSLAHKTTTGMDTGHTQDLHMNVKYDDIWLGRNHCNSQLNGKF